MILAPIIVPGLAVVLGIHVLFIRAGLSNSIPGVILVHLVPTLPYMTLVMSGVFANYDTDFELQARSLGGEPLGHPAADHPAGHLPGRGGGRPVSRS